MQSHSSNEDMRKKLKERIESLKSVVECIDSRKDKELPDLKKVLERFTVYAPRDTYGIYFFSHSGHQEHHSGCKSSVFARGAFSSAPGSPSG